MAPQKANLTPEQVQTKIRELGQEEQWFHCIDLGNGIKTRDELPHLPRLWSHIQRFVPGDLSGKTVLDIGCNAGYFSVAAKKRNADYVLGVDMSPGYLRQAEFARDVLGLDIEYKRMSVYDVPNLNRTFDIVFCLGVIYHCTDPFAAARNVANVTGSLAFVESELLETAEMSDRAAWEFVFPGYQEPVAAAGEAERCYNWWFPNMTALRTLFRTAGFASTDVMYDIGNRGAVVCRK
jgi:tRNA (mo5U34)-methyltransferase